MAGGGTSPQTQISTQAGVAGYAQPYIGNLLGSTQGQIYNTDASGNITGIRGYQPYSQDPRDYVAGFSPMQEQSYYGVSNLQNPEEYDQATDFANRAGSGALGTVDQANLYGGAGSQYGAEGANYGASYGKNAQDPSAVQAYMNPYLQASLNPQLAEIQRQYDITGTQQMGNATRAGAFGGSREALMAAENQRNAGMAKDKIIGQGYNTAFDNAQKQMQAAAELGMRGAESGMRGADIGLRGIGTQQAGYGQAGTAGSNLSNIGARRLEGQQGIYGLQNKYGEQQQTNQQRIIDAALKEYQTAQQYPYTQLNFAKGMLNGLPISTSDQTTYNAAPSLASQLAGLGLTGLAGYNLMGGGKNKDGSAKTNPLVDLLNKTGKGAAGVGKSIYDYIYPPDINDYASVDDFMTAIGATDSGSLSDYIDPGLFDIFKKGGKVGSGLDDLEMYRIMEKNK